MKKNDRTRQLKRNAKSPKRKAKLSKQHKNREPARTPLAYFGNKYKTHELTELVYLTESAIFSAFLGSKREITDDCVMRALQRLVLRLRRNEEPSRADPQVDGIHTFEGLIILRIAEAWEDFAVEYSRTEKIGVLRTLLGSIETWSARGSSRGYLKFLEGFVGQVGGPAAGEAPPEDRDQDELLALGRAWLAGDGTAEHAFRGCAERHVEGGRQGHVAEVCQQLIGEGGTGPASLELMTISVAAQAQIPRALS